jgi:hypothetical protein
MRNLLFWVGKMNHLLLLPNLGTYSISFRSISIFGGGGFKEVNIRPRASEAF